MSSAELDEFRLEFGLAYFSCLRASDGIFNLNVHDIEVRLEETLHCSLAGVYPDRYTPKNSGNGEAVTRFCQVDQLVVNAQ